MSDDASTTQCKDYVPAELPDDVLWGFTREGLHALLQYTHWIPHAKGLVGPFMAKYWPGLSFPVAMSSTAEAGVWVRRGTHFSGKDVADGVKELHLLAGGGSRIVEFEPSDMVPSRPSYADGGGLTVAIDEIDVNSPGGMRELARYLLGRLAPRSQPSTNHPFSEHIPTRLKGVTS